MEKLGKLLEHLKWSTVTLLCLTLGLAPFNPPHFYEKLSMLFSGTLVKPLDWFDFFLHGSPWFLLLLKGIFWMKNIKKSQSASDDS